MKSSSSEILLSQVMIVALFVVTTTLSISFFRPSYPPPPKSFHLLLSTTPALLSRCQLQWAWLASCYAFIIPPTPLPQSPPGSGYIYDFVIGTLRCEDSDDIAIIPSCLLCRMYVNSPGVEFLWALSKLRKRKKISSLIVYILHKIRMKKRQRNVQKSVMHAQSCCFPY